MGVYLCCSGSIPVRLPVASQQQHETPLKTMTVTIDRKGAIYFESDPTTLSGLVELGEGVSRETPVW